MKAFTILAALLPAVVFAVPAADSKNCCSNPNDRQYLIDGCHGTQSASQYCSSVLQTTVTKSACTTVTGAASTITNTVTVKTVATTTSTKTFTSTASTRTTTYLTSTCTPINTSSTSAAAAATTSAVSTGNQKRGAAAYPPSWCFSWQCPWSPNDHPTPSITAHCSCHLGGKTPAPTTITVTSTSTKPGPTSTTCTTVTVAASTSTSVVSTTVTTTTTQVITSTEIEPINPTATYSATGGGNYEDYSNVDFQRGDLANPAGGNYFANCDSDGSGGNFTYNGANLGPCLGFASCQDLCSAINNQNGNLTCVAATYNGPDASGACYFKSSLTGCGVYNDGRRSGLLDLNGYKYQPSS